MFYTSRSIEQAVEALSRLPSVGRKTALRLVLHILRMPQSEVERIAQALLSLKRDTRPCKVCGNLTEEEVCSICASINRKKDMICVVEDIRDVLAIEKTGQYSGVYHVLGGVISPLEGIGPSQLNVEALFDRVREQPQAEVILALNSRTEGETTSHYLSRRLGQAFPQLKLTTLARGLPLGSELEYSDELTLVRSLQNRVSLLRPQPSEE